MFGEMTDQQVLEAIESRALNLLLQEAREDRVRLLQWAEDELDKAGLNPHLSSDRPNQGCHDLIGSNLLLPDWMRARSVHPQDVLQAEDFKDLIDRLTPAYGDG